MEPAMNITNEVDLLLRQAKAHIAVAKKHEDKAYNARKAAGLELIEAKKKVVHGEWQDTLKEYGIAYSTAARLMQEAKDPEAYQANTEADRERQAAMREQAQSMADTLEEVADCFTDEEYFEVFGRKREPKEDKEEDSNLSDPRVFKPKRPEAEGGVIPNPKPKLVFPTTRKLLMKAISKLEEDQWLIILNFIEERFNDELA